MLRLWSEIGTMLGFAIPVQPNLQCVMHKREWSGDLRSLRTIFSGNGSVFFVAGAVKLWYDVIC